jgi:serine/threonine-protein kinase
MPENEPSTVPALAQTIIAAPPDSGWSAATSEPAPRIELVAGDAPRLEAETKALLRMRLKGAALILMAAVASFALRDLFLEVAPGFGIRLVTIGAVAASFALLTWRQALSLRQLRLVELALFGVMAWFLATYQYQLVLLKARAGSATFQLAAVKSCVLYFFAVQLLYGTFIPNSWRRSLLVLVPLGLVPFLVMGILRWRSNDVARIAREVGNFEQVSDAALMLSLGVLASAYGTHIINALRVEAFRARRMGQYRLKQLLGAGGMGQVYLAEHSLLKRPCAIKVIRPDSQHDAQALARFEHEVRATARLTHWNTVNVFDYGQTDDGTFYYVMEYLRGLSLAEIVERHGALSPARAIHLARQACRSLEEAHVQGLIHRDVKPANVFVAQVGVVCDVVKLLDFGLVAQVHAAAAAEGELALAVPAAGTPAFAAPEQLLAPATVDRRADLYALGGTLYYALTGRPPVVAATLGEALRALAEQPVEPPSRLGHAVPQDLEQVIMKCLSKDPNERFGSAQALEAALAACRDEGGWNEEQARAWWRKHEGDRRARQLISESPAL